MTLRTFALCAIVGIAGAGCTTVEQDAAPGPAPVVHVDGPPPGESTPNTGGELFNGSY